MTQEELYAQMLASGPRTAQRQDPTAVMAALATQYGALPAEQQAVVREKAPAPRKAPAAKKAPERVMLNSEQVAAVNPILAMAMDFMDPRPNALDDAVYGKPEKPAPAAASTRSAGSAPSKPQRYNPEQMMLDKLLEGESKWSLNQLGAIAGMREAPPKPPEMKDVVMGQALEIADVDWERNAAAALALDSKSARDEALQEAIDRRQALLLQLLGEGLGPIASE